MMKNLRRWPRLLLGIIYLLAIYRLVVIIRSEYIDTQTSSASNNLSGGIVFGISLVSEEPESLLSSLNSNQSRNDWSTSFLLQSQSPTVNVFADSISVYDNAELSRYCFISINMNKDINVPSEVVFEIQNIPTDSGPDNEKLGALQNTADQSAEYVFQFTKPLCLDRGKKYFVPHLFIGIISSETYADLPLPNFLNFQTITGHRALEFFPFDKQKIAFNLKTYYLDDELKTFRLRPNMDVSISQQGWIGTFEAVGETTVLNLSRPSFYQVILIAFTLIMGILVLFINNIIDEVGSFFEVAFGLLLGLWGTHEILVPNYIDSSIPIDVVIYILYALVIGEMVVVLVDEYFVMTRKRKIKIVKMIKRNLDRERVIIENPSLFPIDMTGWLLYDQAMNKFKFPVFVLKGRNILTGEKRTVSIWTKTGNNDQDDLFWGRRREVWNNDQETAFLEDAKGEAISNCSNQQDEGDIN